MNNKDYITLYSTFAMLCYFQHNMAYSASISGYWQAATGNGIKTV